MLFTDFVFAPFLLLVLVALGLARHRARGQLGVLLVASYVFYGWWDVRFLLLILFSSGLDFYLGRAIHTAGSAARRQYLGLSLLGNLGLLFYFKYAGFFVESLRSALLQAGVSVELPVLDVILPVGISFYTFQSLSYTLDVYFRRLEPEPSLLRFLVYVSAFPQLVAGPIVRAKEMLPQLHGNFFARSDSAGIVYVFYGLLKKLYLADYLGAKVVDRLFNHAPNFGAVDTLFGIYAYAFQIFLDFSAYSDIALGLGLLLGLKLPINFLSPYSAQNPADFWRRWHITLSTWFRDYLYIPLGGNRGGDARLARNLLVVMLVAGLWHGASFTFVLWGAIHGVWLAAYHLLVRRGWLKPERAGREKGRIRRLLCALAVFHVVALAFVVFRAPDLGTAVQVLEGLVAFATPIKLVTGTGCVVLLAAVVAHTFCEPRVAALARRFGRLHFAWQGAAIYVLLALLALSAKQDVSNRLFIYFQF
jgi:alginate O-acetyltransferase complex protein AlgI